MASDRVLGMQSEGRDPLLRWFVYEHLPEDLRGISAAFADLARVVDLTLPVCAERTVALRKLLEAKDAAVRARIVDRDREAKAKADGPPL